VAANSLYVHSSCLLATIPALIPALMRVLSPTARTLLRATRTLPFPKCHPPFSHATLRFPHLAFPPARFAARKTLPQETGPSLLPKMRPSRHLGTSLSHHLHSTLMGAPLCPDGRTSFSRTSTLAPLP